MVLTRMPLAERLGFDHVIAVTLEVGVLFPKRLGQPAEFATLAAELLSNSYINAESIRIDGGIRMQPK